MMLRAALDLKSRRNFINIMFMRMMRNTASNPCHASATRAFLFLFISVQVVGIFRLQLSCPRSADTAYPKNVI